MRSDQVMLGMDPKTGKEIELPADDLFSKWRYRFRLLFRMSHKVKNKVLSIIPTGNLALLGI